MVQYKKPNQQAKQHTSAFLFTDVLALQLITLLVPLALTVVD